jgi:hypothetical protein
VVVIVFIAVLPINGSTSRRLDLKSLPAVGILKTIIA